MKTFVVGTCDPADECTGTEEPAPAGVYVPKGTEFECSERKLCVPESLPPLPRAAVFELDEESSSEGQAQHEDEDEDEDENEDAGDGARAKTAAQPDDGSPVHDKGCGCSPGLTQALPLVLASLIGGLALVRRREP